MLYVKDFEGWLQKKKEIDAREAVDNPKEREVWWCSIGINIGHEQDGKNLLYERPVLIIKVFNKDLVAILPIISSDKIGKYYYPLIQMEQSSVLVLSQIRTISSKRLLRKINEVSVAEYLKISIQLVRIFLY
ncbi:MAG: type II toxin-antitoxin system PemK/MazF family toxin [Candidatus Pacebacteria bacterium]|jgi:mRNA-degrading endonuclease toxin of MazEF toxin-antitoxin module|nr:type II toxin-antitoxin system PemK/MazF family toxin [Candidatus Paceibacterota bacterium]